MQSQVSTAAVETVATELAMPLEDGMAESIGETATALLDALGIGAVVDPPPGGQPARGPPAPPATPDAFGARDANNALLDCFATPRGGGDGPLAGLTIGVKDLIAVAGLETTCGLQSIGVGANHDAAAVGRLLEAGAAIHGKTNMDAFAIGPGGLVSEFGPVTNPVAPERVVGGSSSGSAAAVAAGLVEAALGTDTGGSVRKPAAYCGLVGHKPTHGRIPTTGVVDLAPGLDTVGPIAPDVETAASLFAVMAGEAPDSFVPTAEEYRIGVPRGFVEHASDSVSASFETVLDALADGGDDGPTVALERFDFGTDVNERAYPVILGAEFAWMIRQAGVRHAAPTVDPWSALVYRTVTDRGFNPHIAGRVLAGAVADRVTDGRAYLAARAAVDSFDSSLSAVFDAVDALVMPTVPVEPPRRDAGTADRQVGQSANTRPCNLTGVPALSVPGAPVDGVPIGVQVVAPRGADGRAFAVGELIESSMAT